MLTQPSRSATERRATLVPRKREPKRPSPTPRPKTRKGFIAIASVRSPHGVRGELTVDPLTDFPERFEPGAIVWVAGARYTVRHARPHRKSLLLELEGINSLGQAEALRGRLLEVPERELAQLAEDQYFRFQLVGMDVVYRDGEALGRITEVLETGANDVYIVQSQESELLLPAIDTVIKEVDVAGQRMVVELMEGLERRPLKRPRKR